MRRTNTDEWLSFQQLQSLRDLLPSANIQLEFPNFNLCVRAMELERDPFIKGLPLTPKLERVMEKMGEGRLKESLLSAESYFLPGGKLPEIPIFNRTFSLPQSSRVNPII